MRSLRLEIAQIELQKLGFNLKIRSDGSLVIPNFKRYAEQHLLKEEGAPWPDGKGNYHNYVYPHGIISGFDKIQINKGEYNRIQSIVVPRDCLPQDEPHNPFIDNLRFQIQYAICDNQDREVSEKDRIVTIVLNGDNNSNRVLDFLINQMVARAQAFNPEKNYVSHIGRLIPIVVPYLSVQLRQDLLSGNGDISLLHTLVDQIREDEIDLVLPAALIKMYIDKICRENQKLVQIVDTHLQIRQAPNFMEIDADGIRNQMTLKKIRTHIDSKEPLYIATTTGVHAFAVMIDFKSSTLFIANPGGQCNNFDHILDELERISGCTKVVWANTTRLERSGDIDIDDTCTADALSLVSMMRQHEGPLSEGCLNRQYLRTGEYAWAGLGGAKEVIAENPSLKVGAGAASIAVDEFSKDLESLRERYTEGFILSLTLVEDDLISAQVERAFNQQFASVLSELLAKNSSRQKEIIEFVNDLYRSTLANHEIPQVLREFLVLKLPEIVRVDSPAKSSKTEPNPTLVRDLDPTQMNKTESNSLDKQTLKDCLAAYCPNSWTGIILFIITFGHHRSETIKALDALCDKAKDDEMISLDQMVTAISQETCVDSRKQHRINLFNSNEVSDCSGTDRVIQSILNKAR